MEKVNYLVITKKDEKKVVELKRLLSICGIDVDAIIAENNRLKSEILIKFEDFKKELTAEIDKKLSVIEINSSNNAKKSTEDLSKQIATYLFKGAKINEDL